MNETGTTDFIETLGVVFQAEGLPRIAGRVLAYLIVRGDDCSFNDVVRDLRVSKGSVSTNTRLLVDLGAVERAAKPGDRQDYFRLADAPYEKLLEKGIERTSRARDTLGKAATRLADQSDSTRERLADLVGFFDVAREASEDAVKRLRERRLRKET